jgi:hypothetical protein
MATPCVGDPCTICGYRNSVPISPPGRALEHTNFDVLVAMLVGMAYSTYRPAAARVGEEILRRHADTGAEALREAVGR